jgi:hypothetical protein
LNRSRNLAYVAAGKLHPCLHVTNQTGYLGRRLGNLRG